MADESKNEFIDRLVGKKGGFVAQGAIMRYVAGTIKRERERMAEIFSAAGMKDVAVRILDNSMDDNVFRWRPPSVDLREKSMEPKDKEESDKFEVGE